MKYRGQVPFAHRVSASEYSVVQSIEFDHAPVLSYTWRIMNWNLSLLLGLAPLVCFGHELPEPVFPAGVGVNIHFVTGHERDLDMMAAAGFKFIRMDFGWAGIERQKGQYDWAAYEQLLSNLDKRGMRAVLILDYSNPLYEPEVTSTNPLTHQLHRTIASPQHPESIAAFATWAGAAAKHFQGRHVIWELWNEPNIDFWSPKPDVLQYTALALAASKAVREADPQATLVGPASSGFPWEFLETFLKSGILGYIDAVSVHPYRRPENAPETAGTDYQRLGELVRRYAPAAKQNAILILSGEWGYSTHHHGVALQTQADFAARQQLFNLLEGVPLSIWYDWKNDGNDPNENEHNFGTVTSELEPKPAYTAIKTLTHQLAGYRIARRWSLGGEKDYILVCTNSAGEQQLVSWTTGESHVLTIPISQGANALTGVLSDGQSFQPRRETEGYVMELGRSPKYLMIGYARLR